MIPYKLIAKKIAKEILTEKEENEIKNFLSKSKENRIIFEQCKIIWQNTESENYIFDQEKALIKTKNNISETKKINYSTKKIKFFIKVAAIIIVIFGTAFYSYNFLNENETQFIEIKTNTNETKKINLSDGSIIWLNSESFLKFPEKFSENKRIVKFQGEAFFDIAKNKQKSFIVETKNTDTKVIGTQFNIRAYPDEKYVFLNLKTGKVKFTCNNNKNSMQITENQKVTFNKETETFEKEIVVNENYLSWKTKILSFENIKLKNFASDLSIYFDKNIQVDKSLENKRITIKTFDKMKLENYLEILKKQNFKIDTSKNKIIKIYM